MGACVLNNADVFNALILHSPYIRHTVFRLLRIALLLND